VSAYGTLRNKALYCYLTIDNLAGSEESEALMQNSTKNTKPDQGIKPAQVNEPPKLQPQDVQEQKQKPFKLLILRNYAHGPN